MNLWVIGAVVVITIGLVVGIWYGQRTPARKEEEDDTWLGT